MVFNPNVSLRFYLQFSLDQLHILSPSIAMETHMRGAEQAVMSQGREEPSGGKRRRRGDPRPCVSMVIRVQQKEGVALRNSGAGSYQEEAGLTASFSVTAAVIGPVVSWGRDPKNRPLTDREAEPEREDKLVLVLSGVSARWFPLLQPGCFYRLIAANTQDPSVLIGCGVSQGKGVELHADSTLQVRSDWRFHTLTRPLLLLHTCTQPRSPPVSTLSQVLDCRSGGVYCSQLPVSSLTVTSLGDSSCVRPPPAPMMHLGVWTGSREQRCIVGRVRGHVVCLLLLQLRWSCSLCGGLYTQSCSSAQCGSSSSVFQSTVKLVIDDGTGEAHVWFSGAQVRALLGLADSQWEGLQRALRVRGYIRVYPRGRSLVDPEVNNMRVLPSEWRDDSLTFLYSQVDPEVNNMRCYHLSGEMTL
ncbi:CST complex subunit CTC1 [Dissostichus eleginoides]|uniref:CST complex subunit CTC1 n=1 Tax=Dissostichus eleginoides TaxID=100907 RepID=A0AAD9B3K0_DISEL|nr:CST complex subunit CTC1 [Dissostichus eleginoides]